MPAPAYADTVGTILRATQAAVYTLTPGQQIEEINTTWVCSATGGGDSRAGLAGVLDGYIAATILSTLFTTVKYYGTKIAVLNTFPPPAEVHTIVNTAGTGPGTNSLPTQTRGRVRFGSAVGGRTGRGRVYMFTPDDSFNNDGTPTATYQGKLAGWAGMINGPIIVAGSTWLQCIAHRHKTPPAPATYTYDVATTAVAVQTWATQRRSGETGRVNALPW